MKIRTERIFVRSVFRYALKAVWGVGAALLVIGNLTGCGNGSSSQQLTSLASPALSVSPINTVSAATPTSKSSTCTLATYTPNFAAENDPASGLPNQLYHWNELPVAIYFAPSDYLTSARRSQTLAGFSWWASALGQPVVYREVSSASAANVIVEFQPAGQTNYGAITNYLFDSRHVLVSATINFNMTYLVSITDITSVAAHEFGHALGIGGHSNDTNDVMSSSAQVYYLTNLTTRDTNTLMTAYCGLPVTQSSSTANVGATTKGIRSSTTTIACRFGVPQH